MHMLAQTFNSKRCGENEGDEIDKEIAWIRSFEIGELIEAEFNQVHCISKFAL